LKGARAGQTASARTTSFATIALPSVARTNPGNGDMNGGRFGVNIQFATPMDPQSLEDKVSISGFSAKDLEGRVFTSETSLSANVSLKPSTLYTVNLAAGATDRYGQIMGRYRLSFTSGALPSSVCLALPGYSTVATYSSSAQPIVYFQSTNLPSVRFTLYRLTADEGRRLLHDPSQANNRSFTPSQPAIRTWTETVEGVKDDVVLGSTSLSGGGPLPEGYYFAHTSGEVRSQVAFAVVDTVIVTKLSNNELLAWAIDHDSGKPLAGAIVHATGPGIAPEDVRTDADGLASFSVPIPTLGKNLGDRSYLLWVDGGGRNAVVSTRWQQGVSPYQFGIPGDSFAREWVGHLYTDRPIYRPGETVEYKGIVRADDDAQYSIPSAGAPFQLVITNPRGQQVTKDDVTLGDVGSFAGRFQIPGDAPLGNYSLSIQVKSGANAFAIASNSFLAAEFRAPEFQVDLTTDEPSYVNGDRIDVLAKASFFFGGALSGAAVQWSALADPDAVRVKGFERYSFGDLDDARRAVYKDPLRAKGSAKTGADGVAAYSIPATLQAAEGAQRFTLSATVTDANGQGVASSTTVTVHPATLYVGVHPAQYLATEGRSATIDLVSVDTAGAIAGGRAIVVKVYDRRWITVKEQIPGGGRRYRSEPQDTLVSTLGATTSVDGRASVTLRPTKPGTLRIVAEITDPKGRLARSATSLWVSGGGVASWQITNDDTIKLVADKEQYEVGDTAEVLVPAPFAGATALVTVERGKLITRSVRELPTNSERLAIPITDRSVPDVFVSVVLYRPPTATDPIPRFKVGYVQLPVSTVTRVLNVSVKPDRPQAKPGDIVHYDIKVTDHTGKGVRSEVSVAVVDKAVLSLQDERGPDGLRAFWFERGLGVNTASSMAVSVDRWNDVVVEAAIAGKGGSGGGLASDRARQEFRNTAYWSAQVTTKSDGTAGVDVKLPDNLTTWRTQARAISGDTMVGEGTNELVSTQPLLLRPALPRFLRVGDAAELRVLVRNATGAPSNVNVALQAEGVSVDGELARSATVAPGQSVILSWPAKVQAEGRAKLTFTATGSGGLADSLIQELPILQDLTPETMATGGIVTNEGALEAVYLPPFADTTHGSLDVQVRSALVGSMADELGPLEPKEHESAERVASRLIASLGVRRAEQSADAIKSVSEGRIASDLASVVGRQRPDGGWSWCDDPMCTTDPNVTGWALLALGEARRDGLSFDAGALSRATAYVSGYVNRVTDVASPADPSQKAFLLAALSSAGGGSSALTPLRALFEQERARLTNWGRAYLLLALTDAGVKPDDPQVRALLDDLAVATIPSANGNHWEDGSVKGSLVTNTGATGLGTLALARVQPDHALLPQTVRWLVRARAADGWRTSIDRALGILALTTYAVGTAELGGDYSYKVLLDDKEVLAGLVRKSTTPTEASQKLPLTRMTPGKTSLLAVTRDYGRPGRLYYTLDLRYVTPAKEIEALNRGFAISHEYTSLDDPSKPITSAKLSETVRVKVTVLAPADRTYVVLEDLLPAGLEPVDARLRTVDPALKAKLEAERAKAEQRQAGGYVAPWFRWSYSPWQQVELRDYRAVLYADRLPKGVYEYVYYARATTPGDFFVAPAHAEETYFPDVFGRSDSGRFTVMP
ncbi:MAG: MG2 domain-containing protein, partial [Candidatus Limnocylindria bacterium]|nr:MG2 domain-containing protein [Candidatus Limnocylindria bacterium]